MKMGVFFHDFRSLGDGRRSVIVEERDYYDQLLRNLIRQGQEEKIVCPDIDPKIRTAVRAMTAGQSHAALIREDPAAAQRLHPSDTTRLARARSPAYQYRWL